MGALSGIFLFDHRRYLDCVAPAIHRLLVTGRPGPWLQAIWQRRLQCRSSLDRPLTPTLWPAGQSGSTGSPLYLEEDLSCSEQETVCMLPTGPRAHPPEDLLDLYEHLVKRHCLGPGQYVGHAERPQWFLDELRVDGITVPDRLTTLLQLLDSRARAWTHGSTGSAEGLHGWLTPEETREAAVLLSYLPLPSYPPSFQTMRSFRVVGGYHPPGGSRAALFLSFLRTVANLAWPRAQGIAWGNDVFAAAEDLPPPRIELSHRSHEGGIVVKLARALRAERSFADLPILADALEEAGCSDSTILSHLREAGAHLHGCWVLDLLAGQ